MKKHAFTLAEILVAMTAIGTIATMCIPVVMLGITNSRHQASYKRAYKVIHSIMAVEQLNGKLPASTTKENVASIFEAMITSLNVKEFAIQENNAPNDGIIAKPENFKTSISYLSSKQKPTFWGSGNNTLTDTNDWTSVPSPWIITDDNIAYSVIGVSNDGCLKKEELNSITEISELNKKSCAIVIVDTNGLVIGPNSLETQVIEGIKPDSKIETLKKDRYYIYIGKNGVASGPKSTSLSGRLMAGLK